MPTSCKTPEALVVSLRSMAGVTDAFVTRTDAAETGWPEASNTWIKSDPLLLLLSKLLGAMVEVIAKAVLRVHDVQRAVISTNL